jgi:hypothetical protein
MSATTVSDDSLDHKSVYLGIRWTGSINNSLSPILPMPVVEYFVDFHQLKYDQRTHLDIADKRRKLLDDLLKHPLRFVLLAEVCPVRVKCSR